MNNCKYQT